MPKRRTHEPTHEELTPAMTVHEGDARVISEAVETVETDHGDGSIAVLVPTVTVAVSMMQAIEGAFFTSGSKQAAQDHAADPSCPYPHDAADLTRCPVLASYQKRDAEAYEGEQRVAERTRQALAAQQRAQAELQENRRRARAEIARRQGAGR